MVGLILVFKFASLKGNVYLVDGPDIVVANFESGKVQRITRGRYPSVSSSGTQIAFIRDSTLWVHNLVTGTESSLTQRNLLAEEASDRGSLAEGFEPAWSHDEKYLLASVPTKIKIVGAGGYDSVFNEGFPADSVIWTIKRIRVVVGGNGQSSIKNTGQILFGPSPHGLGRFELTSSVCPAISPDGSRIAFCRSGDLWCADTCGNTVSDEMPNTYAERKWTLGQDTGGSNYTQFIYRLSWSPSGRKLAVSSRRIGGGGVNVVTILSTSGGFRELDSFFGRNASFISEESVVFVGTNQTASGLIVRSLGQKKDETLRVKGDWPTVARKLTKSR